MSTCLYADRPCDCSPGEQCPSSLHPDYSEYRAYLKREEWIEWVGLTFIGFTLGIVMVLAW